VGAVKSGAMSPRRTVMMDLLVAVVRS